MNNLIENQELNPSSLIVHKYLEKTIKVINITDETLALKFQDNSELIFKDDGQSCCENRYMNCDDDLKYYIGSNFLGYEIKDGPTKSTESGDLECSFFVLYTSKGEFTVNNYNSHNGYYGSFNLVIKEV